MLFSCLQQQNQFKSQGNKLIPDNPDEQALMYQRLFEVLTLMQKGSMLRFLPAKRSRFLITVA